MAGKPLIGVLALQGDFNAHQRMVQKAGGRTLPVKHIEDLKHLHGLILPGGESTTYLTFFQSAPWFESIKNFSQDHPILGTCAGAILMAEKVENPPQASLGIMPVRVYRNAYGRQVASFIASLTRHSFGEEPLEAVFIRAPRFTHLSKNIKVLGYLEEDPVILQYGKHLACTFHPELTEDIRIHAYFLRLIDGNY